MGDMTVATPTIGVAPALFPDTRRPSRSSTRSLQFGAMVVGVDVVLATVSVAVLYLFADPVHVHQIAVLLDGAKFAVVGSLAGLAIRSGIRGLHETAGGRLTRRRWAIAGIAIGAFFGMLVAMSFVATTVMTLAA